MDKMRLEIDGEHAGVKFSACHFIAGHEKCGRLHGHSYVVSIKLHGSIGEHGMVMDFVPLKKALREHSRRSGPSCTDTGELEADHRLRRATRSSSRRTTRRYVFPAEDVVLLDTEESSAEELSRLFLLRLLEQVDFPENVSRLEVGIDEELGQSAWATHDFSVILNESGLTCCPAGWIPR